MKAESRAAKVERIKKALEFKPFYSDRRIAEECKVSHPTVASVRRKFFGNSKRVVRFGRDGKKRYHYKDFEWFDELVAEVARINWIISRTKVMLNNDSEFTLSLKRQRKSRKLLRGFLEKAGVKMAEEFQSLIDKL